MKNDIKLTIPEGCGNAPRKLVLQDFNVALVSNDHPFILENIADKVTWNTIGDEIIEGKSAFINKLDQLYNVNILELIIHDIITHGYVASVHGKVIGTNRSFDFCHVYKFTGASKTAKIKEMTSYIIPMKE